MTHPQSAGNSNSMGMIRIMTVVSLVCGLLIVATQQITQGRIHRNQELLLRETVEQLLPAIHKQVVYGIESSGDLTILSDPETPMPKLLAGYDTAGRLIGIVIEASDTGYADVIRAMYAYSPAKQAVVGFRVVEMRETPGLGDKIGKDPEFLENFRALDAQLDTSKTRLAHPIAAVKHGAKKNAWEIDAISGATISSRAVGRMIEQSASKMAPLIARHLARIERGE